MTYLTIRRLSLSLLFSLGISSFTWADTTPNPSQINTWQAANPQSKAIEFARQAGSIAGIAQACGQNVTEFTQRVSEAINKLTTNPTDKTGAMLIYQQISREAQLNEQKMQTIPCTKVLQDYQNLPIMQANYQEKVIAQLDPSQP